MKLLDKTVGVNQILPHKNKWAWDLFIKGCANNWMPTAIRMQKDIEQWKSKTTLSDDEKLVLKRCLGFFAGSESLVSNNLLISIYPHIADGECRQYILRQAFEESLHNLTIVYICDSLQLDIKEVYEAYKTIPSIKAKDDFLMKITSDMTGDATKQEVLRNLISYYIICEGIFFYSGFAMLLSFGRQNKMTGVAEQIQYTLRDESLHIQFGTNLINSICEQYPEVWTKEFQQETVEHIKTAMALEIEYAHDVLPRGILGLNAHMFVDYMKYIANRRLESIKLPLLNEEARNPFPWLSEAIDLPKVKNFFETRVTEYQTGGTLKDDF